MIDIKEKLDKALENERHSVFGFFIQKFKITYLILLTIIFVGGFALMTLPREADPEVKIPFAIVTTVYPGATPTDMEDLVTNKIEDKIKNLENLRRYTSGSSTGVSSVFVEFEADADIKESVRKLKDAVDLTKTSLPADAEDPVVTELRANDIPIVTYSLVGEYSDPELKTFADDIQEALESISGVSKVPILGGVEQEYLIIADQTRLQQFGLSLGQIVSSVNRNNFNLPVGNIEIDGFEYNIRVKGKFKEAEAINDIVIATKEGSPVYVRDVARVYDTFKEKTTESRIGFPENEPNNTVSLQLYKKTGGNIIKIIDESQLVINNLQESKTLPAQLHIEKTNDNAVWIRDDLNTLGKSGLTTIVLIFIILTIAIGFREAVITGLSVPIAFFMTFIALHIQDMTLNGIVLFSLVLSLGLMVDNSIIITEGINEYMDNHAKKPLEAALLSVWNYKWPIIAGTMTTVSAFLPMLLVSGILGQYISYLPKTITWALLSSLFVALIILPTLSARKIKPNKGNTKHDLTWFQKYIDSKKIHYKNFLRGILPNKKKRRTYIAGVWILFIVSIAMPVSGIMGIEMFATVDTEYFVINIELPNGSVLEATKNKTAKVEKIVSQIPELKNYVSNVGTSASIGLTQDSSGGSGSHLASITVNLVEKEERNRKSYEIIDSVRPEIEKVQGMNIRIQELSGGPPTGAPIEIRIKGDSMRELGLLSSELVEILENIKGTTNVKDNLIDSTGEFVFTIDKQKANYYGLDVVQISSALRGVVYGTKASTVTVAGEDVDITVKYDESKFDSVNDLENILLTTNSGDSIPLKQVADVSLEPAVTSISHRDGKKTVVIQSDVEQDANLQAILTEFDEKSTQIPLSQGYVIEVGGEVEDIEKSFRETFYSMIVAVLLIAFILVLQFNSFKQPFIIIFTLPLAIIGVIFGLMLMGQDFGFLAFIGIVALAGIVVNDAIVLIDKINKNLADGVDYFDAIIDGGSARIQPIILTSVTTIAGIFPLIFANEMWRSLSYTVIFGLAFSTILTLVIVPIMYAGMCKKEANSRMHGDV
jgi:multidrug efflux pump subunit AcrB